MADAVKSDEIEDVLSSIRRLVSEHQPPARSEPVEVEQTAPSTPAEVTATPAPNDRLLLTPALRVTDPEDPWLPITSRTADEVPDSAAPSAQEPGRDDGADWARELWAEEQSEIPDNAASFTAAEDHGVDPQLQADQWEASGAPGPEVELATPDAALPDPIDVTEALLQEVEDPTTEDGIEDFSDIPLSFIRSTSSVSDYEPEEGNIALPNGDLPTPTLELAEARAAHADTAIPEPSETPRVKVEIVKALTSEETEDDVEPEVPETEAADEAEITEPRVDFSEVSAATETLDCTLEADVTDFLASDPEELSGATPTDGAVEDLGETPFSFPDDSDGFVDEEALREIIAEVVREELQGEMGVRITRNVRKLVRREIRLALAAQDIE